MIKQTENKGAFAVSEVCRTIVLCTYVRNYSLCICHLNWIARCASHLVHRPTRMYGTGTVARMMIIVVSLHHCSPRHYVDYVPIELKKTCESVRATKWGKQQIHQKITRSSTTLQIQASVVIKLFILHILCYFDLDQFVN